MFKNYMRTIKIEKNFKIFFRFGFVFFRYRWILWIEILVGKKVRVEGGDLVLDRGSRECEGRWWWLMARIWI